MTNAYKSTHDALEAALSNANLKVVALTGTWGTGKTHLWKSMSRHHKNIVEISAFGVKTIEELKLKIIQSNFQPKNHEIREYTDKVKK